MKIGYKLFIAFATIVFIMIIGSLYSTRIMHDSLREMISQNYMISAQQIMETIDREIYHRLEETLGYRGDGTLQEALCESNQTMAEMVNREVRIKQRDRDWIDAPNGTITTFMEELMSNSLAKDLQKKKEFYTQKWLKHPIYPEMYVTNKYGVIIATTGRTSDYFQADEEWYQRAVEQEEFLLSEVEYDKSAESYGCDIVVKIYDDNQKFVGVFKVVLNIEIVYSILKSVFDQHLRYSGHGDQEPLHIQLVTKGGQIVFDNGNEYEIGEDISDHEFVRQILKDNDQIPISISKYGYIGSKKLYVYAKSSGYRDYDGLGWVLIIEHDSAKIFGLVYSLKRYIWFVYAILITIAFVLIFRFSRSFAKLVEKLRITTGQLQQKITIHKQTEAELQEQTFHLNERIKELNCLYAISNLLEKHGLSLDEILNEIVEIIPPSWQYPEITCARIIFQKKKFKTKNFQETTWKLSQPLIIQEKKVGVIEVFYLEEKPDRYEGPFQLEERNLINAISVQLGHVFEWIQAMQEKQQMEAFIFQQEKLASVGQLAAGVAHEINNPTGYISSNLSSLRGYIEKLMQYIDASTGNLTAEELQKLRKKLKIDFIVTDVNNLINESSDGAKRISEIVNNLKSFSRLDEAKCIEADINECIENTLKVIWNELKYKADIIKKFGELPLVKCYPQELNQVFMNFLINAVHAIDTKGEIIIKTWTNSDNIFVSIADTGNGIPAENMNKLFEPFFTTKDVGKGTGLGLSIAYKIIEKHKGRIYVKSEVGRGSTFTINIPLVGVS